MFPSILSVAHNLGYPALVLLIMLESSGVPLPGETALITAAVLASQHRLQIALVIALAAAAAIVGDNVGYLIGRKGGRWLLLRPGPFAGHRARVLEVGEPFFARHGSKAVFVGRWILGLRTWASWLAGASHMPWRSFSLWNAAGGITWATTIGLVAYYAGHSATSTIALFGVAGLTSTLGLPGVLLARRRRRRRHQAPAPPPGPMPSPERKRPAPRSDRQPAGRSCRPRPPTGVDLSRSDGGDRVRPRSDAANYRLTHPHRVSSGEPDDHDR
jgi:membrane protein DedA with SNARE-associated domain